MAVFSFRTIQARAEGQFKEKGSRFLSFACPVKDEEEIKKTLQTLRKEFYDARHHCYAWVLGPDRKHFRANDDGEPNHTAGDPILGQIRSLELTNVLVVVVRYFGGVKLGVGGLIAAYKVAAFEALKSATVVEREVVDTITLIYPYEETASVMKMVKDLELVIREQSYDEMPSLKIEFAIRKKSVMYDRLDLLQKLGKNIKIRNDAG